MENDEQFKSWIEQYYDRLIYIAFTYVRNPGQAEDVVQESFVKAYRSFHQLKDLSRPFPWLVRIVINESHTWVRKTKRESPTETLPEEITVSTEDVYIRSAQNQEIYVAVMSLPEKYRTPIILFYFENLSIREAAEALSVSEGAFKTRLSRGRARLKDILKRGELNGLGITYPARQA